MHYIHRYTNQPFARHRFKSWMVRHTRKTVGSSSTVCLHRDGAILMVVGDLPLGQKR